MPILTIGDTSMEVPAGQRLVLAIEGVGVQIGHRCGGHARCTTCRVTFAAGEPETMTSAEYQKLVERGLLGQFRLACQIVCDHDMSVTPAMTVQSEHWTDAGPEPEPTVTPDPATHPITELQDE